MSNKVQELLKQLEACHTEERLKLIAVLKARWEQIRPKPKPKLVLNLVRRTGPESLYRPTYAKWASALLAGQAVRILTTYNRPVCFIPGSVFGEDSGIDKGTLMVTYVGGTTYQGVIELDFTKSPNPYFLNASGFPVHIATLICKTIYAMFPHLNPLTPEDQQILSQSGQTKKGARGTLKMAALLNRKGPSTKTIAKKTTKPGVVNTSSTPPTQPVTKEPTETNGTRPTQQQENHSDTGSKPASPSPSEGRSELPHDSRGQRVRNRRQGKRGSEAKKPDAGQPAPVLPPTGEAS